MRKVTLQELPKRTFRANPDFELLLFDRLSPDEQVLLQDLKEDPDFYGILRSREGAGLGVKSVCRETALLFLTLQAPGPLPGYVRAQSGDQWPEAVVEMVLDGVLQIEADGGFVSGAEAHGLFYDGPPGNAAANAIAQLSVDAIRYAQALPLNDVQALSQRLYFYNRVPLTPGWKRQYPTPYAVAERLGIRGGGPNQRLLTSYWTATSSPTPDDGWFAWQARHIRTASRRPATTYKLYLSPSPTRLPDAFVAVLKTSPSLRALAFKVGKDVYGLLRPDKLVIYFASLDDLAEGAEHLRRELDGCPAQGVPFSAAITPDGLLSWGIDPPRTAQTRLPSMGESWRLWITNRLARALLTARVSQPATVEPWQFALDRLRLEEIDTRTWAPSKTMWKRYAGGKE